MSKSKLDFLVERQRQEIEERLLKVQYATRSRFVQLEKPHNFMVTRLSWYKAWHENPWVTKLHAYALAIYSVFMISFLVFNVFGNPFGAKAAGNYYVDDDSNCVNGCGSQAQPFKTIQAAANVVSAGDTVYIAEGVYNERVTVSRSGTSGNVIKFTKQGTNKPQINRGIVVSGSYIEFSEFMPWPMYGGIGSETAAVQVMGNNNYIHHFDIPTGSLGGSAIVINEQGSASYNVVSNFGITDTNGVCGAYGPQTSYNIIKDGYCYGFGDNVAIGNLDGSNNTLENVEISGVGTSHTTSGWSAAANADADGIHPLGDNNVIRGVKIHHLWPTPLASDAHTDSIQFWNHCGNLLIENSTFGSYASAPADSAAPGSSDPPNAVLMMAGFESGSSIVFRNNIVLGNSGGAGYWAQFNESGAYDVQMDFYNNTIWSETNFMSKPHMVGSFRNNILRSDYSGYTGWTPLDSVTFSNNMFQTTDDARGTNNIFGDPRFVNGDVSSATNYGVNADFHIQVSSPAVNAGIANSTDSKVPLTDKDGNSRIGATDMGAYEHRPVKYVDDNGSATWTACSDISQPCSFATAVANYSSGETIYMREGTYSNRSTLSRSGTAQNHVTFRPYNNELVTFTRGFIVTGSYIDFISGGTYDWDTKSYSNLNFRITEGQSGLATSNHGGQVDNRGAYNTYDGWQCVNITAVNSASCFYFRSGNYSTLKNFYMHNLENAGASTYGGMTGTIITQGEIQDFHASEGALNVYGYNFNYAIDTLVEKVWVHGPNSMVSAGGIATRQGDGIHALGLNTTIRNCIFDVYQEYEENPYNTSETPGPHTDNVMIYGNDAYDNVVIENTIMGTWNTTYGFDVVQHPFTIDPATDFVTTAPDHNGLSPYYYINPAATGGTPIKFSTSGVLPGELNTTARFYPVNLQSDGSFQLSTTAGGSVINLTSTGTGTHTWKKDAGTTHSNGFGIIIGQGAGDRITLRNNIVMSHPNNTPLSPYRNAAQQPSCGIGDATLTVEWYNNIIWGGGGSTYGGTKKMRNNIFLTKPSSAPGDSDYNVFVGTSKPSGEGTNSFTVPDVSSLGFSQYDMNNATQYGIFNDWSPASGSPLIGRGEGGIDIGAYEYQGGGGGGDTTNPTVSLTAPSDGANISGTVTISASASDNVAVSSLEFYDGNTLLGSDSSSPYSYSWNTNSVSLGSHIVKAKAIDSSNNSTTVQRTISVVDSTNPSASISSPSGGATVSGTVQFLATATDNRTISKVEFYDGIYLIGTDTDLEPISTYRLAWNTLNVANGSHIISVKAYDQSNNTATSATRQINVSNTVTTTNGYLVNGWGGVHPFGGAPKLNQSFGWPGWDIARDIVLKSDNQGGYVLNGWGGVHPFGNASAVTITGNWTGWDIARAIALRSDGRSGYVLNGWGGIHPFGGAPKITGTYDTWPGWDIARDIVLVTDTSGYVLDGWGGIHPFGGAPGVAITGYWPGWDIAEALVLRSNKTSGYVLNGWGGVHPFGGAPKVAITGDWTGWDIARDLVLINDTQGYVINGWGGVHPFGGAPSIPNNLQTYWLNWDIVNGFVIRK